MALTTLTCPKCTAPLPPTSASALVCAFCDHVVVDVPDAWRLRPVVVPPWGGRKEDAGKPRCGLGKHVYVIDGRLGRGDSSDVFLAHRDTRLTQRVALKVLRAEADADLLAREVRVVRELRASETEGADFFRRLLPEPIAHGALRLHDAAGSRTPGKVRSGGPLATAFRFRAGFEATASDIREVFPRGVDPRHAVWMWKRVLDMLGWLHRAGVVHGAVLPPHLLVRPDAHAVVLLGWGATTWRLGRARSLLPARSERFAALYPAAATKPPEPALDLAMLARTLLWLTDGARVPAPVRRLLETCADRPPTDDAWALKDQVSKAAEAVWGPPKFVPFVLPASRSRA